MNPGDALLVGSAWLALLLAAAGESLRGGRADQVARGLWSAGGGLLLAHFASAFHLRHHWSHAAAVADTARQMRDLTGLEWGGGVWFNYAFTLLWAADVIAWWGWTSPWQRATNWLLFTRLFFLFMWLNAAFVFVRGPARWVGLAICGAPVLARVVVRWRGQRRAFIRR
jgi:hypothetical protein